MLIEQTVVYADVSGGPRERDVSGDSRFHPLNKQHFCSEMPWPTPNYSVLERNTRSYLRPRQRTFFFRRGTMSPDVSAQKWLLSSPVDIDWIRLLSQRAFDVS